MARKSDSLRFNRRTFMKASAATGAALAAGGVFAPAARAAKTIKIGYVSPQTGPLAPFGEADKFVTANFQSFAKDGLKIGNATYPVEVIVKDSQSNPNRAAEVAKELIVSDKIDLMLVASTPETTNPVSTQCEIEEVPCISTVAPWQPYFIGRQANPGAPPTWKPFNYTYHFFWGLEDVIAVFTNMWGQVATNKSIGGLFPNDGDGNAWGVEAGRLPAGARQARLQAHRSRPLSEPHRRFQRADRGLQEGGLRDRHRRDDPAGLHHVLEPGASSRASSRRSPRSARRCLFPVAVEALGKNGNNLSSEVWWTPNHPFKSSLTGQSAKALADAYQKATGKQWTQPIGFVHALFELAVDVLKRSHRRRRQQGDRRRDRLDQARHRRRAHRVGRQEPAAVCAEERRQDAAGRRPVAHP